MTDEKAEPLEAGWKLLQELAQREAELEIINSVQQGLAARLEVQAIYDLVGDKIRDLFDAQVVMISTYDRQTDTVEHRYAIERGERVYAPGHFPPGGFRAQIVKTRQPLLVNMGRCGSSTPPRAADPAGDHPSQVLVRRAHAGRRPGHRRSEPAGCRAGKRLRRIGCYGCCKQWLLP